MTIHCTSEMFACKTRNIVKFDIKLSKNQPNFAKFKKFKKCWRSEVNLKKMIRWPKYR